jgi:tetratricopeptide (TPR) repeat protein
MDRFNLGSHSWPISTPSADAQRWFDRGLNWCFSFNREEGVKCFRKALEFDPECVMANWGIAYGAGPFYNLIWRELGEQETKAVTKLAHHHVEKARSHSHRATDLENHLVRALARRFQKPHPVPAEEFDRWDDDYAAEMRRIYNAYPDNHDVMALLVEALITRTPRSLWDVKTGLPASNSDVLEAIRICERSIELNDQPSRSQHPSIVHLHIHALEMSNEPDRAMKSADALSGLCPDAGHMNHMPGHIYVLCGDYERARQASEKAISANDDYIAYAGPLNYYTVACSHDLHLMIHTCMFMGRYADSINAANKLCNLLTKDILSVKDRPKFTMSLEGYYSVRMHVLVRFGRWQDIIDEPLPDDPELYLVTTAMHHYAKGVAHASLKDFPAADKERRRFHDSLGRIPLARRFFNNPAHSILAIAESMLDGELEYHKGNHELGYAHLRESVRRDDNLQYIEPWAWMHPPRHALAALLAEQGHYREAEQVYRDDLGLSSAIQRCAQHPDNVWALHGLAECLQKRGDTGELPIIQHKLARALELADIPITSSCMCRTTTHKPDHCCH